MILDGKIPSGPLSQKWDNRRAELKLVNPANKRKYRVIVIGTGLAGASAAASLGELGYNVDVFFSQDSPRRAHSIAAQGGINAAKNYPNDGDSVERLFYDTIKGGDFRSREANVYRLAQLSCSIIDQAVAQGVPFARDYAGYLATRSFGGAQVSRTFYARGQTGQQLLLGAYGALLRQTKLGTVTLHPRTEMLDLVLVNGEAKGVTVRDLVTGAIESHAADAVCLCSGGYANVFFLSTNSVDSQRERRLPRVQARRIFRQSLLHPDPPHLHPRHRRTPGQAHAHVRVARNDGRVWVPKQKGDTRPPDQIPEAERDYFLERKYPLLREPGRAGRLLASGKGGLRRGPGRGARTAEACTSTSPMPSSGWARTRSASATATSSRCTSGSRTRTPISSPCACTPRRTTPWAGSGWTMIWKAASRASSSLAKRTSRTTARTASAQARLMQGLADGYFIAALHHRRTIWPGRSRAARRTELPEFTRSRDEVTAFTQELLSIKGKRTPAEFHRELGKLMWDNVGMARSEASLKEALETHPRASARSSGRTCWSPEAAWS